MASISPTEDEVLAVIRSFIMAVVDDAGVTPVIKGQNNRVPEPKEGDFFELTVMRFNRLNTNIDGAGDALYTGSIVGTQLTVSDIAFGTIRLQAPVYGLGVTIGTKILAQVAGTPGGVGVYLISVSQVVASEPMASGTIVLEQHAMMAIQMDVYGNNSADKVQLIATTFRDAWAVDFFETARIAGDIIPLFAGDPHQMPFENEQKQIEQRWVADLNVQVNQVVSLGQQYADAVTVGLISVDAAYPPS